MSNQVLFTLIFIVSVLVTSASQILLKISADKEHPTRLAEYFNPYVIIGYSLFFAATLVTVFAYRYVPLSWGPVLESLGYVFVAALGYLVLKEKIRGKKLIGMLVIIAGVIVFSL